VCVVCVCVCTRARLYMCLCVYVCVLASNVGCKSVFGVQVTPQMGCLQVVSRVVIKRSEGDQIISQDVRACVLRLCKFLNTFNFSESCYFRCPPSNLVTFEQMHSSLWRA